MNSTSLVHYYARRAPEYDRIYEKPERQGNLSELRELVRETFSGRRVLEIACGTGYWTEVLAQSAASVTAIDINEEVLKIARSKTGQAAVEFEKGDAYALPPSPPYSGALAVFWWSHLPKERLASFLAGLHEKLLPGAEVMFIDNRFVPGNSTPLSRTDAHGNAYQIRKLDDGSHYEVLKNFPTATELRAAVALIGKRISVRFLDYYWILRYDAAVAGGS